MQKKHPLSLFQLRILAFLLIGGLTACDFSIKPPTHTPDAIAAGAGSEFSGDGKINLNNMTLVALRAQIPGISQRMAYEFFEYQPYETIERFREEMIDWVDQATVTEYEKRVFVPIDVDTSDVQTLMQIPGVTEDIAALLTAVRPLGTHEAFLGILSESLSEVQLDVAATYLCNEKPSE